MRLIMRRHTSREWHIETRLGEHRRLLIVGIPSHREVQRIRYAYPHLGNGTGPDQLPFPDADTRPAWHRIHVLRWTYEGSLSVPDHSVRHTRNLSEAMG
jgi:hypothetical protein